MSSLSVIGTLMFVRLFRLWAAARAKDENPLPAMHEVLGLFVPSPELSVACASLFELVEAHLGRRLVPECCCSTALSRDEQALLGVLRHAPGAGQPLASAAVPHGLPGAIRWAALATGRALARSFGDGFEKLADTTPGDPPQACPFGSPPVLFASAARTAATAGTN